MYCNHGTANLCRELWIIQWLNTGTETCSMTKHAVLWSTWSIRFVCSISCSMGILAWAFQQKLKFTHLGWQVCGSASSATSLEQCMGDAIAWWHMPTFYPMPRESTSFTRWGRVTSCPVPTLLLLSRLAGVWNAASIVSPLQGKAAADKLIVKQMANLSPVLSFLCCC